jgi:hydroxypyruvate isomerase
VRTYGARFEVNCSILFAELPVERRAAAAAKAGFAGVEFWWPWEGMVPSDAEADAFVGSIAEAGVALVSMNFHTGDMAAGERGILSHPARAGEFRENVGAAVEIARRAGCGLLNAPYGVRLPGVDVAEQEAVAIENLLFAGDEAAKAGVSVLVEAINSVDIPGFPVDTSGKALAVINEVNRAAAASTAGAARQGGAGAPTTGAGCPAGRARIGLLADLYHLARMGEDVADVLSRHRESILHVQVADVPGRGAPGTGCLDFEPLLKQLAGQEYGGWVGLEYVPSDRSDSASSFGWL